MKKAADHAGNEWMDSAHKAILKYLEFIGDGKWAAEDFRAWSKDILEVPENLKAFGPVMLRAKKQGLIKHIGFIQVKNSKAHQANASVWQRKK